MKIPKFVIFITCLFIFAFVGQVYLGVQSIGWKPTIVITGITILIFAYPLYRTLKDLYNTLKKSG